MSLATGKDVLVTGAETGVARAIAATLAGDPEIRHVLCVHAADEGTLPQDSAVMRHVAVDMTRAREVRDLLFAEDSRAVRALIHVPHVARERVPKGVAPVVAATQRLLSAAEEHPQIERIVVVSSADVYRIASDEPMLIDEDHPLELSAGAPAAVRERVEVDLVACARVGVSRLQIAVLRCAEVLAPGTSGQLFDYLSSRVCLRPLGYDPMLNVLSLADAAEAVRLALASTEHGVFNIPGADTLPLSELIHAAGRLGLAVPGTLLESLYALRAATTSFRFRYASERKLFHYGAIVDGRRAQHVLGYAPAHRVDLCALFSADSHTAD